jgi:hypothetical protein
MVVAVMAASLIMNCWQNQSQKLIQTPATTATTVIDDCLLYKKYRKRWISVLFSIRRLKLTILEFQPILSEIVCSTKHFRTAVELMTAKFGTEIPCQ